MKIATNKDFAVTYDQRTRVIGLENAAEEGRYSYRLLKKFIKPGRKVLDLGCGRGSILNPLADQGVNITGIDYSIESVNLLKEAGRDVIQGIIPDILKNINSGSFDAIISFEFLEHLDQTDIERVFIESKRLLKPKGLLIFTVPKDEDLSTRIIACPHCHEKFHLHGHLSSFSAQKIHDLAQKHGFRIRKIYRIYGLVAYKLHIPLWIIRILSNFEIKIKKIRRPIGNFMVVLESY